jgi:hypothetical protein
MPAAEGRGEQTDSIEPKPPETSERHSYPSADGRCSRLSGWRISDWGTLPVVGIDQNGYIWDTQR